VRFVGVSGYPMKMFKFILDQTDLDVVLSYNHYTLQNTMLGDLVPYLKAKGRRHHDAAPFSARLLTNQPLPPWHKATPEVRAICKKLPTTVPRMAWISPNWRCNSALANEDLTTCVVGSANPANVQKWIEWSRTAARF